MRHFAFLLTGAVAICCAAPAHAAETISYSYDARGRLITVARAGTVNNGVTTSYAFNKANNRTIHRTSGVAGGAFVVPINGYKVVPTG